MAVLQAFFRKKRRNLGGFDLPDHVYEQILYRRVQVMEKSPECWESGNCVWCGCDIQGKTMCDNECERNDEKGSCYPSMMSKENWASYKRIYNIKLFN